MRNEMGNTFRRVLRTVWGAIRARPGMFLGVALAVFLLDVFLPPVTLALVRKPWDHFSFNPWLSQLPAWVVSPEASLGRKLEFLSNVSLAWFIASSPYDAPEWGFSIDVRDLARWLFMAGAFGAYFALWSQARGRLARRPGWRGGGRGGFTGALLSTLGLFTSPCSVAGCGVPVLPVLGLTLQGLTSGTLAALSTFSRVASMVVLVGVSLAVLALAWIVSRDQEGRPEPAAVVGSGRSAGRLLGE
jgi:hypothetical protein